MEIFLAGMAVISADDENIGIVQTQYDQCQGSFIQGGLSDIRTGISNREQELEKELEKA